MKYCFISNSKLQNTHLPFSQIFIFLILIRTHCITPYQAGKPLQGMELQDKEHKEEKHIGKQNKKCLE